MAILGLMLASTPGLGAEVVKLPHPSDKGTMSIEAL